MKRIAVFLLICMAACVQAELLGTWNINISRNFEPEEPPDGIGDAYFGIEGEALHYYIGTAGDPAELDDYYWDQYGAHVRDALTDGVNSQIGLSVPLSMWEPISLHASAMEADVFGSSPYSKNGVDFAGYEIDAIELTVTAASCRTTVEESWSEWSGQWLYWLYTDAHFSGAISVYGQAIPEPASITLIGLFTTGIWFKRRIFVG